MTASGGHQSALARVLRRTGVMLAVAATCGLMLVLYLAPRVGAACGDPSETTIFSAAVTLFASTGCPHFPEASFTATPNPVVPSGTVNFDGSASNDPDDTAGGGAIATYQWDYDGDTNYDTTAVPTATTSHVYAARGRFLSRLRVTDNDLPDPAQAAPLSDITIVPINVTRTTAAFTATNPGPLTAEVITLDATASNNPDGTGAMTFDWDLDANGTYETSSGSSRTLPASWTTAGNRVVGLRVTDDSGAQVFAAQTIAVQNRAPVAAFSATPPVIAGQAATLNAGGSSDPDGTVVHYEWDFDNNGSYETDGGAASAIAHAFPFNGTATVGLKVTDNNGAPGTTTRPITVTRAPFAQIAASPNPATAGQKVSLSAAGSGALDGLLARYDWDLDGNGSYETFTGLNPATSRAYPNRGRITVAVRVTDSFFGTATKYVTLTIADAAGGGGGEGGGSGGGTGGGGGGTSGGGATRFTASLGGAPIQKLKLISRKGVALSCKANRVATCTLRAELTLKVAQRYGLAAASKPVRKGQKRPKAKPVRIGSARVSLRKAGVGSARIKLSAKVKRAFARQKKVSVTVRGTAVDRSGKKVTLTRVFVLRR